MMQIRLSSITPALRPQGFEAWARDESLGGEWTSVNDGSRPSRGG